MAATMFLSPSLDLRPHYTERGVDFLHKVEELVKNYRTKKVQLKKPAKAVFRFAELEDTIYRKKPEVADWWGKFYMPDEARMLVVGVVEGISCPSKEIVLMTCQNQKLYGFDGEELHLMASNLDKLLFHKEIEYPAKETYYYGEAFKNMTEEDWRVVKKGRVGKRLDEEYNRMVEDKKMSFLQKLQSAAH